jgi:osmotically-inducible protein OsmY
VRRLIFAGILVLSSLVSEAGTLDDMELRSNVETLIRGTAQTAGLHLKIQVEDRVAIPEGLVRDLNQADDVATLAAKVKGITGVDRSRLRLEFPASSDDGLAARVGRTLFELPRYASSSMKIAVENGVVTLTGAIKNAAWRGEIHRLCGGIEGVVDVVDRLDTPETPDERIQKALDNVFGVHVLPRFPGHVRAVAKDGVVTLDGRVPRLYEKQAAEHDARGINGVRRVDNRLELGSNKGVRVTDP